jgi:uncharacterized integral membrane protein (TIGR00698 family)
LNSSIIFLLGIILSASGLVSSPVALIGGLAFGLTIAHPFSSINRALSRFLLQAAVVLLGFGMNLRDVAEAGKAGFLFTFVSITFALTLGWILGQMLRVSPKGSFLITCGTAICGGSAIAAVAPVMDAPEEDIAISLGTVFTLNAIALLIFPMIGWRLHLSQNQFGLWCALAIHDTSSVVGAAARFGPRALMIGTTVKLARALWIIPVSLATAFFCSRRASAAGKQTTGSDIQIPWFIGLFLLAALIRSLVPSGQSLYGNLAGLGRKSLTVVLFLIGTGLSRETLRRVGVRPMVQGLTLWIAIALASLLAITRGWISI